MILLLPLLILLWVIGWTMLWSGSQNEQSKAKSRTVSMRDGIEIVAIPPEEVAAEPESE